MRKILVLLAGLFLACLVLAFLLTMLKPERPSGDSLSVTTTDDEMEKEIITLHYFERVPYMQTVGDTVVGLTAGPAGRAFQLAGIPFRWQKTPPKRQLYIIHQNMGRDCLIGWFKNPDREQIGRFTLAIYQDEPTVALARRDNDRITSGGTVDDLLTDRSVVLLVKDGFSYGRYLDRLIATRAPQRITTTVGNVEMLKMIQAGRADYLFVAPEEAQALLMETVFSADDFQIVYFSDMPPGEKRYLWCSMRVEDAVITRLNEAIRQIGPLHHPTPAAAGQQ